VSKIPNPLTNVVSMPQGGEDSERFRKRFSANLNAALDQLDEVPVGYGRVTTAAHMLGVSANTMNAWLKGVSLPEIWRLPEIANRLDTTVDQLITGNFASPSRIDEHYAMLSVHGQSTLDEAQTIFALPETLRFLRISRDTRMMRIESADMEGFASPGDFVIYDPSSRQISMAGGVFVLDAHGHILVRRACRTIRNQIILSCDNPHIPDESLLDSDFTGSDNELGKLFVLGQVVGKFTPRI